MQPYQEYERLMRSYCQLSSADDPLDADAPMAHLGIDSAQIVGLILELENLFGIEFPDEYFTPETFATPNTLWAVVKSRLELSASDIQ